MNVLMETIPPPAVAPGNGLRLLAAAPALWRVVDATGVVVGHLQALAQDTGTRYRAQRFHAVSRSFRALGEFWTADEAVECLRFAR
jgi:hypothetical protein